MSSTPSAPLPPPLDALRDALTRPLPGSEAHRDAWPEDLPPRHAPAGTPLRNAAVLLALFRDPSGDRAEWRFPMVRRPSHLRHHARQIGFPGGSREAGETPEQCALREAREEIGIDPTNVTLLGRLSRIEIPVSRFAVDPIVAWLPERPREWRLQEEEVEAVLIADLDDLARDGPLDRYRREREGSVIDAPAFSVEAQQVWGASALILSELCWVWREITGGGSGASE